MKQEDRSYVEMRLVWFVISRVSGSGRSTMQLCSIYFLRHSYRLSVNFCIIKNVGSLSLVDRRELEQEFRKKEC